MISSFTKFNESLTSDIDKLKSDVDDAFAYISDENKVSTYIRESEVYVDILSILPNNIVYSDMEEYINKHEIWHEVLLDINVAIEQLTSKGNVGVVLNINTVGNVKIKFHLIHDKLFRNDNNQIIISTINLTKFLKEEGIEFISISEDSANSFILNFNNQYKQKEVEDEIIKIFIDNGLSESSIRVDSWQNYTFAASSFSTKIFIRENRRNINDNIMGTFKRIKLREII